MDIGHRLKFAREAIGYTQAKVAQECGIGISSISAFENNEREPKFSQLCLLADVYKREAEFFLTDEPLIEEVMIWRKKPTNEEERKEIEAEFRKLCEQYHNLELCTNELKRVKLPQPDIDKAEQFTFEQAESFARKVQKELCLGDIPSASLRKILEERYYIKIFHLEFSGSAISIISEKFGPSVLLNAKNKLWRRNFDLAHELFHLLTKKLFGTGNGEHSELEEKLANPFASKLLMPDDSLRQRIDLCKDEEGKVGFDQLYDIAREFGVSLDALVWRMKNMYRIPPEKVEKHLEAAKKLANLRKPRETDKPDKFPERYRDLALRALREGKMSLMQFKKYMEIKYREAEEYLIDEENITDEEISIPIT